MAPKYKDCDADNTNMSQTSHEIFSLIKMTKLQQAT